MIKPFSLSALLLCSGFAAAATTPVTYAKTSAGDEYGFIAQAQPRPLAIVFTTTIASSLNGEFTSVGLMLAKAGFVVASIDLPCHGADVESRVQRLIDRVTKGKESGEGLSCWASKVSNSDHDYFAPFLERLKRVLSDMRARKLVAGDRVVVVGVSRGGYLALRAAAADDRITDVVSLAPVTDLKRLDEFRQVKVNESIYGLTKSASVLAKRHLFLQIGSADTRVGTHQVLQLVDAITAAGGGGAVDLTLVVTPAPGHTTAEHNRAAQWVVAELSADALKPAASPPPPK